MKQLRQPRLAELVAARLREDILSGRLKEGDNLPPQEELFNQFRVSLPAVREAMRILETEGLVTVRRGNVGGAVVHLPTQQGIARMISMVLQSRHTSLSDVSASIMHLEPAAAALCAGREDRAETVVPDLTAAVEAQHAAFDDPARFPMLARHFHETLVQQCGNETTIVLIGALETIWTAHESRTWAEATALEADLDPSSPLARKSRRAALRDHEKLLAAIAAGDGRRAAGLAAAHLGATRASSLGSSSLHTVSTSVLDDPEQTTRSFHPVSTGST